MKLQVFDSILPECLSPDIIIGSARFAKPEELDFVFQAERRITAISYTNDSSLVTGRSLFYLDHGSI